MSLANIKQKELKGKKKVLPKLRTILANPYKQHSPVLPENEVAAFRKIVENAIRSSNYALKTFATKTNIHLGLESSLRAINGARFSCVFISLSIRPTHLLRLIATSAAVKLPTAPIYAQPKLEELTEELFGVRSLILVLPTDLDGISPDLSKWVSAHKKKSVLQSTKSFAAPQKVPKKPKPQTIAVSAVALEQQVGEPVQPTKEWSGDYISCIDGGVLGVHVGDAQMEAQKLDIALSHMVMKAQPKNADKPVQNAATLQSVEKVKVEPMQVDETDEDEDEFLPTSKLSTYHPVTVHQIRPNPDKKPKKKRKKNKNKSN
ncbi:hypothetical protein KR093_008917 [Drosophila rubida]|uniref:Uncharacterized protein n=1 Tax=Drosophila rubida TaxID=30044 RepID=A0AAD4JUH4_9MUSC|nr:hypothetical protein KR093_008917 [Drosophila rubida]